MNNKNICKYWEMGYCKFGRDCRFYHPPIEEYNDRRYDNSAQTYYKSTGYSYEQNKKYTLGRGANKVVLTQKQIETSYKNFLMEVESMGRGECWPYFDYSPAGPNAASFGGVIYSPEEVRVAYYKYENEDNRLELLKMHLEQLKNKNLSAIFNVAHQIKSVDDYRDIIFSREDPKKEEEPNIYTMFDHITPDTIVELNKEEIFSDEVSEDELSSDDDNLKQNIRNEKPDKRIRINVQDDFVEDEANMFLDLTIYSYEDTLDKRQIKSYKKALFKPKHGVPSLPPTSQLCSHPMYYF